MATATIEIDVETATALKAQAQARNLTLPQFLNQLIASSAPLNLHTPLPQDELDRLIDDASSDSPVLPADFSRADIYNIHD